MARSHFDIELRGLQLEVARLGELAAAMVERATQAFFAHNVTLADAVIADDDEVDDLAREVEDTTIWLISTQQPVARDLRCIAGALTIAVELERIGDYGQGIAVISRKFATAPTGPIVEELRGMAERAAAMLRLGRQAYLDGDVDKARAVWAMDDALDDSRRVVYREVLTAIQQTPTEAETLIWLMHVAHNLERCGDRMTNICERILYIEQGDASLVKQPVEVKPGTGSLG